MTIHHRLADDGAESAALCFLEKYVGRFEGNGGKKQRSECAVAKQLVIKRTSYFSRVYRILELLLGREGVAVEPFQKMTAVRTDHLDLWSVEMRVDESGRDQRRGAKLDDLTFRMLGPFADRGNAPHVVDGEVAIFEVLIRSVDLVRERVGERSEDPCAINRRQTKLRESPLPAWPRGSASPAPWLWWSRPLLRPRSEEHTSELQSPCK